MSPYDAEDGSPSPEPGTDLETSGIMAEEKAERASTEEKSPAQGSSGESKPVTKSNAKDPSRPRRKKARRACFACQRAHLTCGDERPCLRCIKRGLQDQCHDGVRKKAKYLHDAPAEALMPGFSGHYHLNGAQQSMTAGPSSNPVGPNGVPISQAANYMGQPGSGSYQHQQYGSANQAPQLSSHMANNTDPMLSSFGPQQHVGTPSDFQSASSQQVSPAQTLTGNLEQGPSLDNSGNQAYDPSFLDPNDPALFNLDVSGFNFGNHYGALEFGMLGQMSSGAAGGSDMDAMGSLSGPSHHGNLSYDPNAGFTQANNFNFNQYPGWQGPPSGLTRQSSSGNLWTPQHQGTDAFAIGEPSLTGTSPQSQTLDFNSAYQPATLSPESQFAQVEPSQNQPPGLLRQSFAQPAQQQSKSLQSYSNQGNVRKRQRDSSEIYTRVEAPYPYTQGFHALTAFLGKRFDRERTLRIARALASIRPSFISCNKGLDNYDLIFMEKCFQRTLCEYEDFVNHYGTPTIICRRTGEIAAVSKEFSLVTGWRRDVLLGKEANLNINADSDNSGTQTGNSSRGGATPRMPNVSIDPGRPQPVFLAELMDKDSVVQFYEDFAEVAFGASRTSIIGQRCALLKYKTKDDAGWRTDDFADDGTRMKRTVSGEIKTEPFLKGEAGMNALGEQDGRVECSMCWTVKRDVFDIPMLIVMNFLPII